MYITLLMFRVHSKRQLINRQGGGSDGARQFGSLRPAACEQLQKPVLLQRRRPTSCSRRPAYPPNASLPRHRAVARLDLLASLSCAKPCRGAAARSSSIFQPRNYRRLREANRRSGAAAVAPNFTRPTPSCPVGLEPTRVLQLTTFDVTVRETSASDCSCYCSSIRACRKF